MGCENGGDEFITLRKKVVNCLDGALHLHPASFSLLVFLPSTDQARWLAGTLCPYERRIHISRHLNAQHVELLRFHSEMIVILNASNWRPATKRVGTYFIRVADN